MPQTQKYSRLLSVFLVLVVLTTNFGSLQLISQKLTPSKANAADANGCDFYASTTGTSGNTGTLASPWDLQTALSKTTQITSGSTLCLKGGTYVGRFFSSLSGTSAGNITVRSAPGEWAILDSNISYTLVEAMDGTSGADRNAPVPCKFSFGTALPPQSNLVVDDEVLRIFGYSNGYTTCYRGQNSSSAGTTPVIPHLAGAKAESDQAALTVNGSYVTFRNFEITNSKLPRLTPKSRNQAGGHFANSLMPGSIEIFSPNSKFINLLIQNAGSGMSFWTPATNSELYGNIVYHNGWISPARGHGHNFYSQNNSTDVNSKKIRENTFFGGFSAGIQIYGSTNAGILGGYTIDGNLQLDDHDSIYSDLDGKVHYTKLDNNFAYGKDSFYSLSAGTNTSQANNYELYWETSNATKKLKVNNGFQTLPTTGTSIKCQPSTENGGEFKRVYVYNFESSRTTLDWNPSCLGLVSGTQYELYDIQKIKGGLDQVFSPVQKFTYNGGNLTLPLNLTETQAPLGYSARTELDATTGDRANLPTLTHTSNEFNGFLIVKSGTFGTTSIQSSSITPTASFSSATYNTSANATTTITFSTSGGVSADINPKISGCAIYPNKSNQTCVLVPTTTTTYTLTVASPNGSLASAQSQISFAAASLSASLTPKSSEIALGSGQSLTITTSGAAAASVIPAIPGCNVTPNASLTCTASPTTTTVYKLTATSSSNVATSSTAVLYVKSPSIAPLSTNNCDYFVSTTGTPSGLGTSGSPWDIVTAFSQASLNMAGKGMCLRGGTYSRPAGIYTPTLYNNFSQNAFEIKFKGTTSSPAVVRSYPGEVAILDGKNNPFGRVLSADRNSNNVTIYDLELTNSNPNREAVNDSNGILQESAATSWFYCVILGDVQCPAVPAGYATGTPINTNMNRTLCFSVDSPNFRLINSVLHDCGGGGIFVGNDAAHFQAYGNVVYHNGTHDKDRPHGHGIYAQNNSTTSPKIFTDNIVFNNLGYNIHSYGQAAGNLWGLTYEGNIVPGTDVESETSVYNDIGPGNNSHPWLIGGYSPLEGVQVKNNYASKQRTDFWFGDQNNKDIRFERNVFDGGLGAFWWNKLMAVGNWFSYYEYRSIPTIPWPDYSRYQYENNSYYPNWWSPQNIMFPNGTNSSYTTSQWQGLGYDLNGKNYVSSEFNSVTSKPNTKLQFTRKNQFVQGKANIALYNWNRKTTDTSVSVDLSETGLVNGQAYRIIDPLNYSATRNTPIYTGTYNSASPTITLPFSSFTYGQSSATKIVFKHAAPDFFTLIVTPESSVSTPTPVNPTASLSSSAALVKANTQVTLTYGTSNGTSASFSPSISGCNPSPNTLSQSCTFIPATTATYTLSVTSSGGTTVTAGTTITVDATAPTLNITSPANNLSTTTASIAVTGTVSDNIAVSAINWTNSLGGSGSITNQATYSTNVPLVVGTNVITITATDTAGNQSTKQVSIIRVTPDTTVPTVTITNPASATTVNAATIALSGTASDNTAVTAVTWSNSAGGTGNFNGTTSWSGNVSLQLGSNIITVTAIDAAGNQAIKTLAVTYSQVDTQSPVMNLNTYPSVSQSSVLNLSGTGSDNVGITSGTWVNSAGGSGNVTLSGTNWSAVIGLVSGVNTITITARDAAGNTSDLTATVSYTPVVTVSLYPKIAFSTRKVYSSEYFSMSWNAEGADYAYLNVDVPGCTTATVNGGITEYRLTSLKNVCTAKLQATGETRTYTFVITSVKSSSKFYGQQSISVTPLPVVEIIALNGASMANNPVSILTTDGIDLRSGVSISGGQIRYTTDGTSVLSTSPAYSGVPLTLPSGNQQVKAKYFLNSDAGPENSKSFSVSTPSGSAGGAYSTNWYVEAESGSETAPISEASDPTGETYIRTTTDSQGTSVINLQVPESGNYAIWGRVFVPDAGGSFHLSANSGNYDIWDVAGTGGTWQWKRIAGRNCQNRIISGQITNFNCGTPGRVNPKPFAFSTGANTLNIYGLAANTKLDKLFITKSLTTVPTDQVGSGADSASPVITLNSPISATISGTKGNITDQSPVISGKVTDNVSVSSLVFIDQTGRQVNLPLGTATDGSRTFSFQVGLGAAVETAIRLVAKDSTGNINNFVVYITYVPSLSPVQITPPGPNINSTDKVSLSTPDTFAGLVIRYAIDGVVNSSSLIYNAINKINLPSGNHTIRTRSFLGLLMGPESTATYTVTGPVSTSQTIEVESGIINQNFSGYTVSGAGMSQVVLNGNTYVGLDKDPTVSANRDGNCTGTGGSVTVTFDVTDTSKTYYMWAKVISDDSNTDSLCTVVDGNIASKDTYDTSEGYWSVTGPKWTRVVGRSQNGGNPVTQNPPASAQGKQFTFTTTGAHTITFLGRDPRTLLDKIFVTTDPSEVPQ